MCLVTYVFTTLLGGKPPSAWEPFFTVGSLTTSKHYGIT
jgi:hypothetical protein